MQDGSFNSDKELQLAYAFELEDILNKLPIDLEIKKMFQDLISYRFVGSHVEMCIRDSPICGERTCASA